MSGEKSLSHFDAAGNARMVEVGLKPETLRCATASATITMSAEAYRLVREGKMSKGDVLGVARLAGIMAAKQVPHLIPLCHPLTISRVDIEFAFHDEQLAIGIEATVGVTGKTGVEMEALTAASLSALTIYDMCKAVDKSMVISGVQLLRKSGGKSGDYVRGANGGGQ